MAYIRPTYNADSITWVGRPVYTRPAYNAGNVTWYVEGLRPTQVELLTQGFAPSLAFGVGLTAVQGSIAFTGYTPSIATARIYGTRFDYSANIQFVLPNAISLDGGTFTQTPKLFGGALVLGRRFKSQPVLALSAAQTAYVTGSKFQTTPLLSAQAIETICLKASGLFATSSQLFGGGTIAGRTAQSGLSAVIVSPESIKVIGEAFTGRLVVYQEAIHTIAVTGRGFVSGIAYSSVYGRGFTANPILKADYSVEYAEAYVMNLAAQAEENIYPVTRYEQFPFHHIARINNQYYGVAKTGLYRLTDAVAVDSYIQTKDDDLGPFNSKNIPYIYLNGDDNYQVTPYVDDIQQPMFNSGFNGRRARLARGMKGRYWYFKIGGIKELYGIEYMPDGLGRKVK